MQNMVCHSTSDSPDWNDDRVELHFSLAGKQLTPSKGYFSINPDGVYLTYFKVKKEDLDIRTRKNSDSWEVSFRLPFKALGFAGNSGALWRISAGRFHRTGMQAASALAPVNGHFNREENAFLPFVLSDTGTIPAAILSSPGEMAEHANATGDNVLVFDLPEGTDASRWDLKINGQTVPLFAIHKNQISYLYQVSGVQGERLRWQLSDGNGKVMSTGDYEPAVFNPSSRVFATPNPLFQELFGQNRKTPRLNMTWNMLFDPRNYHQALKTGVPYSQDAIHARLKQANVRVMLHSAGDLMEQLPEMRKGNYYRPKGNELLDFAKLTSSGKALPCVWYSYYGISGEDSDHTKGITWRDVGFFGMPLDPINRKAYLALAENVAKNTKGTLGVYFFGDELTTICTTRGLEMNTDFNRKVHGEFLDQWNNDVKNKFGGGRFGIPWGKNAKSADWAPSNLAYFTYMASELAELGRETREKIQKINPSLVMLSDDAYGNPSAHGVQYWKRYADCGSFQLGEGGGTSGQDFPDYMFTTKLVRDMSGLNELMVCPHEAVDGYPSGAMSSEEIAEAFSQCIRGGATGFHFWPASFTGKSRANENAWSNAIGYPAAYEYMLHYAELFNKMPELQFPETKTAVLVADDTMIATGKFPKLRGAFRLLGLNNGGWFKFVSDTHVRNGWCDLNQFSVCYIPAGEVLRPETAEKLEQFVRNGGILVCADTEFARVNQFFEDSSNLRKGLLGVAFESVSKQKIQWGSQLLSLEGDMRKLIPVDKSQGKVLGTYQDGSIAIYERPLGKGKTICFGFDLFLEENAEKPVVSEIFTDFYRQLGGTTGHDIWRFKLPVPKLAQPTLPQGKCLTGNYGFWNRHKFMPGRLQNLTLPGKVTVTRAGAAPATAAFTASKVTDRLNYFKNSERFNQLDGGQFVEKFGEGTHSVEFEFDKTVSVNDLVFYHAGGSAKIALEVLSGDQYKEIAQMTVPASGSMEVRKAAFPVRAEGKKFRLTMTVEKSAEFILAEAELWGNPR